MVSRPAALGAMFGVLAAAGLLGLWLAGGDDARAIALAPDDASLVADGRAIYAEACASCHGADLEGQPNWRQRNADGRLPAPAHDPSGHTWHHPDMVLFTLTKYGPTALSDGGRYQSDMPGFEGVLDDRSIIAVLSYIKSTWPAEIRRRHDEMNARAIGAMK
jgi:mono/diheme cytochrome c family protein